MKNKVITMSTITLLLMAFVLTTTTFIKADGRLLSTSLQKDLNNQVIQVAPRAQFYDNLALTNTITTLDITTNVVTVTTATAHGYAINQRVTINLLTGPTLYADVNNIYVIASVPTTTTFTVALTHADIVSGAATGTTTAYQISPIPTGTTTIKLVFPPGSYSLLLMPTVASNSTFNYTTNTIDGSYTLQLNVNNVVPGVEGDVVYIKRPSTTPLTFMFLLGR